MQLSHFIQQLLASGTVTVEGRINTFSLADEQQATRLLHEYYNEDKEEMPGTVPAFHQAAAVWAAKYFYTAAMLTVLRDEGEAIINEKLLPFSETINASAMYSADLILRYLPNLLQLAKGLSPADMLVRVLEQTAAVWPFSSAGIETGEIKNEEIIFTDPSLCIAYTDRLITAKDIKRISGNELKQQLLSAAGLHLETFWPAATTIFKNDI